MRKNLLGILFAGLSFFTFSSTRFDNISCGHLYELTKEIGRAGKVPLDKNAENYIPCEKELRKIEKTPYDSIKYNCVNKAIDYHEILKKNGEISYVAGIWTRPSKRLHAVVYCLNKKTGKFCKIDPTNEDSYQFDGIPLESYKEDFVISIHARNASLEEIKKSLKRIEFFQENYELYEKSNVEKN